MPAHHGKITESSNFGLAHSAIVQLRTPEHRLRHPSWRGLRTDRSPSSARRTPEPIAPPAQGTVIGAMQTVDARWRVEAVRRGGQHFYRLIHGDNVIDGLVIATLQRLLAEAGGIGGLPSRPADAPTSQGGAETREHRIHPIEEPRRVGPEPVNHHQFTGAQRPAERRWGGVLKRSQGPVRSRPDRYGRMCPSRVLSAQPSTPMAPHSVATAVASSSSCSASSERPSR